MHTHSTCTECYPRSSTASTNPISSSAGNKRRKLTQLLDITTQILNRIHCICADTNTCIQQVHNDLLAISNEENGATLQSSVQLEDDEAFRRLDVQLTNVHQSLVALDVARQKVGGPTPYPDIAKFF